MTRRPDFIGVGAMRSGSTTLWSELKRHPDVFLPETKELHFFDDDAKYGRGKDTYFAEFAPAAPRQLTGEITPAYMFQEVWRRRLHETVPEAKLLVILRDPVARAWSHWQFSVLYGPERLRFEQALDRESDRIKADRTGLLYYSYVARGLYAEQVARLFDLFGRERVLVLFMEELKSDRRASLDRLQRFLGLHDPFPEDKGEVSNRTTRFPRSIALHQTAKALRARKGTGLDARAMRRLGSILLDSNFTSRTPTLEPQLEARLKETFAAPDRQLEELLGRPLPWVS